VVTSNILIPVWRQKRKPLHRFVVRWRFHQNWSNTECLIAWHNCKVTVTLSRYSGMYVTIPYVSVADFWLPAREMLSHAYLHAPHAKGSIVQRGVNQHLPVIRLIPPSLSALSLSVGGSPPALFLFWQWFQRCQLRQLCRSAPNSPKMPHHEQKLLQCRAVRALFIFQQLVMVNGGLLALSMSAFVPPAYAIGSREPSPFAKADHVLALDNTKRQRQGGY
jgi:hypothetical protein